MKKGILSITGCALALGLVAAPAANASTVKFPVSNDHSAKEVLKNHTIKNPTFKVTDSKLPLAPFNRNINNVDSNFQALVKKVDGFYTNPATSKNEREFYNTTLGKLKASSKRLASYKNQLDHISRKNGKIEHLTLLYEEVNNLQASVTYEITNLNHFHTNFVPVTPSGSDNQV
jgi:hypothetical protein